MPIETTADLKLDPQNPRKISEEQKAKLLLSLDTFGDLSGIVMNRRTRMLVGGHQRTTLFGPDCKVDAKYFDKPDRQGTVGLGYITLKDGSRHGYREVDWPKEKAAAANIAANAHGGEWEESALRQMLTLVSEGEGENAVDPDTLGLTDDFVENLFRGYEHGLNAQEQEASALTQPLTISEIKNLPTSTRVVQLFFTVESRESFLLNVGKLQVVYGTKSATETITKAVDLALHENK